MFKTFALNAESNSRQEPAAAHSTDSSKVSGTAQLSSAQRGVAGYVRKELRSTYIIFIVIIVLVQKTFVRL